MKNTLLILCLMGLLVACGGGADDERPPRTPFYTPTPVPSLTPNAPVVGQPVTVALTNNFSRADGALRVQYPNGWVVDTEGEAVAGTLDLASSSSVLRGNFSNAGDMALRVQWAPTIDFVEAEIARDADPLTLLTAILAEREAGAYTEPLLLDDPLAARVDAVQATDGVQTTLFTVDFGAGVSGLFTVQYMGAGDTLEPLMLALVGATRYGGPPAITEDEGFLQPLLALDHDGVWVRGALWSADGQRILTWADDGVVRLWDVASGETVQTFFHPVKIEQVLWFADETRLLVLPEGQSLYLWDVASGEQLFVFNPIGTLQSFVLAPNQQMVMGLIRNFATGSSNATIWDLTTGQEVASLRPGIGGTVEGAAWSHDSARAIIYGLDPRADVWDVATGEAVFAVTHNAAIVNAVWRDNDTQLMTLGRDSMLYIWDLISGEPILTLTHTTAVPVGAAWNSDNSRIITWQADRVGRIWDATTGDILFTFENRPSLGGAVWNADETRLLSWSAAQVPSPMVRVWDIATGEAVVSLSEQRLTDASAWHEPHLVTWTDNGTLNVWDTTTAGEPLVQMRHESTQGARWNPSTTQVLSWSRAGTVLVWTVPPSGGE